MPTTPTALLAVHWSLANAASDDIVNVFAVSKLGSADPFDIEDLSTTVNEVGQAWSDTVGTVVTNELDIVSVQARDASAGAGFSIDIDPDEGAWLNTDTATATVPWQGALVSYQSSSPGRSGRGRTFLAGIRAEFIDSSGTVNALFRTQLATQFGLWHEAIQDVGQEIPVAPVVYSRKNDSVATIINSQVRPLVAIQRDRRAGSA